MVRQLVIYKAEAIADGTHHVGICYSVEKRSEEQLAPGNYKYLGTLKLEGPEEWANQTISELEGDKFAIQTLQFNEGDAGEWNLQRVKDIAVRYPNNIERLYLFRLHSDADLIAYRDASGKPVYVQYYAHVKDKEGASLPTEMGTWKFFHELVRDPASEQWKSRIVKDIEEKGYHLDEKEIPIKEDADPLYYFFDKFTPQHVEGNVWALRIAFTQDIFGANLPVWFDKKFKHGLFPERVDTKQNWDLAALRKRVKQEGYVIDEYRYSISKEMRSEGRPSEPRVTVEDVKNGAATSVPPVDEDIAGMVDDIYSKLK